MTLESRLAVLVLCAAVLSLPACSQSAPANSAAAGKPAAGNAADEEIEGVQVHLGDRLILGDPEAPFTLVEFTDFQCGFCRRFHENTFPAIRKNYVDTGRLRVVHRDLPLDFHAQALPAARAARCAGEQKQFWPMRERLLKNASAMSPEVIKAQATALALKMDEFEACLASDRHDAAIRRDMRSASLVGIDGTPGFVLGYSRKNSVIGVVLLGAHEFDTFDALLKGFETAGKPGPGSPLPE